MAAKYVADGIRMFSRKKVSHLWRILLISLQYKHVSQEKPGRVIKNIPMSIEIFGLGNSFDLVPFIVVFEHCLMYCVRSGITYHFGDLQDLLIFLYMWFYCYSSSLLLYLNQL